MTEMTNKREPGYYWVKYDGELMIAKYTKGSYDRCWTSELSRFPHGESNYEEIGSRITPEMKYTEEDMIEFARFVWYNKDLKDTTKGLVHYIEEWLEQRKEEQK